MEKILVVVTCKKKIIREMEWKQKTLKDSTTILIRTKIVYLYSIESEVMYNEF